MIDTQNMKITKFMFLVLAACGILALMPLSAAAATPVPHAPPVINITVEGKRLEMPVPPAIVENRLLVGARFVAEAVGAEVGWNPATRQVTITRRSDMVIITLNKKEALVNGKTVVMEVPAQVVSDRTLVPLRFIAEALGGAAEWDQQTRTANILRKPTAVTDMKYIRDVGKTRLELSLSEPLLQVSPVETPEKAVLLDLYPAVITADKPFLILLDSLMRSAVLSVDGRTVRLNAQLWHQPTARQYLSPDGMTLTVEFAHTITGINHTVDGRVPIVSIASNGRLNYSTLELSDPSRLVFDLAGVRLGKEIPTTVDINQTPVSRIRAGQFSAAPEIARVVLDLVKSHPPEIVSTDLGIQLKFIPQVDVIKADKLQGKTRLTLPFSLPVDSLVTWAADRKQIQVHIPQGRSVMKESLIKVADGTIDTVEVADGPLPNSMVITVSLPYYLGHTVVSKSGDASVIIDIISSPVYGKRIWVDAGHGKIPGGKDDPGAIGATTKVKEKDLNLWIAQELKKQLEGAGAVVLMTRTGDEGIDFTERPDLVNKQRPPVDLFLSIHHNSTTNSTTRGTETYYWTTNPKSKILAEKIHPQLLKALGFPDRKVRQESFLVIQKTTMPAVLLELGYLSNPVEEKLIAEPGVAVRTYPGKVAAAITAGIFDYFWQEIRPAGTN